MLKVHMTHLKVHVTSPTASGWPDYADSSRPQLKVRVNWQEGQTFEMYQWRSMKTWQPCTYLLHQLVFFSLFFLYSISQGFSVACLLVMHQWRSMKTWQPCTYLLHSLVFLGHYFFLYLHLFTSLAHFPLTLLSLLPLLVKYHWRSRKTWQPWTYLLHQLVFISISKGFSVAPWQSSSALSDNIFIG